MKLSCVLCMFTKVGSESQPPDNELVFVIGGMSVCLDHSPFTPGHMELSRAITKVNENDRRVEELSQQVMRQYGAD